MEVHLTGPPDQKGRQKCARCGRPFTDVPKATWPVGVSVRIRRDIGGCQLQEMVDAAPTCPDGG